MVTFSGNNYFASFSMAQVEGGGYKPLRVWSLNGLKIRGTRPNSRREIPFLDLMSTSDLRIHVQL